MKRFLSLILSFVLMLSLLSSCSSDKPEQAEEQTASSRPAPEAKYNPQILDAGRRKNSYNTSDLWYPDNGDGTVYIYFTKTESDIYMTYVQNKTEKKVKCSFSEGNRLISEKIDGVSFDFAFYDAFNCYDFNGECWYSRGDVNEIKAAFAGKTLANHADNSNTYFMKDDGTCVEEYKGSSIDGTWNITASTALVITFGDYSYTYDIDFDNEGKIVGISQRGGRAFDIVG